MDKELEDPNVWGDPDRAQALGKERASLEAVVRTLDQIHGALDEAQELFSLAEEECDSGTLADVAEEVAKVNRTIEELEFRRMFAGEMDQHNAYLDIQSGSGGTEAQDTTRRSWRPNCYDAPPPLVADVCDDCTTRMLDGESRDERTLRRCYAEMPV